MAYVPESRGDETFAEKKLHKHAGDAAIAADLKTAGNESPTEREARGNKAIESGDVRTAAAMLYTGSDKDDANKLDLLAKTYRNRANRQAVKVRGGTYGVAGGFRAEAKALLLNLQSLAIDAFPALQRKRVAREKRNSPSPKAA